ncbi:MAG: hypothetical protein M1825_006456 [Sarcosagium campestre]|nr:MAG: hypothetical protein M1825_006456 [Sarcosagium campestre]
MAGVINIGDVLMLSQMAWKIGSAFTAGRKGAPHEFEEVENELRSLTNSLVLLAETLEETDSILAAADQKTQTGVKRVFDCCKQTILELESFVNRYQDIKSPAPDDGHRAERSWKQVLVRNYKTLWWTTEGGNIQSVRNMLHMHVSAIAMTMDALKSKSLSRLEQTLAPMALTIGSMDTKIDEMHRIMLSVTHNATSNESARQIDASPSIPLLRGRSEMDLCIEELEQTLNQNPYTSGMLPPSPRRTPDLELPERMERHSMSTPPSLSGIDSDSSRNNAPNPWNSGPIVPSSGTLHPQARMPTRGPSVHPALNPPVQSRQPSQSTTIRSDPGETVETLHLRTNEPPARDMSFGAPSRSHSINGIEVFTQEMARHASVPTLGSTLSGVHLPSKRTSTSSTAVSLLSEASQATASFEQHEAFQKALWTNAMTLLEVNYKNVSYTKFDESIQDYKVVQAGMAGRLYVIQKQTIDSNGNRSFSISIWALSDDRTTRLQHKLADAENTVPYTTWGSSCKVVIRVKSTLKFHDVVHDAKPLRVAESSWITYEFTKTPDSDAFQSAVMQKTLLLSLPTNKTLRVHDGIVGAFAYQEQMCALENLKIWHDMDEGSVLAMIHYTPQFADGYLCFCRTLNFFSPFMTSLFFSLLLSTEKPADRVPSSTVNSPRDRVRLRSDGERGVKIKGLRIEQAHRGQRGSLSARSRNGSVISTSSNGGSPTPTVKPALGVKHINAARIEFTTVADKIAFMEKVKEVQGFSFAE